MPSEPRAQSAAEADLAAALAGLVDGRRRRALLIQTIDGAPATKSPMAEALLRAGFQKKGAALFMRAPGYGESPRQGETHR
jgi:hypothetical protein